MVSANVDDRIFRQSFFFQSVQDLADLSVDIGKGIVEQGLKCDQRQVLECGVVQLGHDVVNAVERDMLCLSSRRRQAHVRDRMSTASV